MHRVGQRLLAVDVLAPLDGGHGDDRVQMVRCPDHYRIDVLVLLVQHLAKILVFFGIGVASERSACMSPVHIAQRHDVLTADGINVIACSPKA